MEIWGLQHHLCKGMIESIKEKRQEVTSMFFGCWAGLVLLCRVALHVAFQCVAVNAGVIV